MVAPSYVNVGTASTSTDPVASHAPAYPAAIVAGRLLLLFCQNSAPASVPGPPSAPGWTLWKHEVYDPGSSPRAAHSIFYRWADGTEAGTVTVTYATNCDGVTYIVQLADVGQELNGSPAHEGYGFEKSAGVATPPAIVTTGPDRLGCLANVFTDQRFTSSAHAGLTVQVSLGTANGNPRGYFGTSAIPSATSTTYGTGSNQRHVLHTFALASVPLLAAGPARRSALAVL